MRVLKYEPFAQAWDIPQYVKRKNIKQEDIQQIFYDGKRIVLLYWIQK